MTGPPPKPSALRLIEGNPGRRPFNEDEPKPELILPKCPKHLSPEARRHYHYLGKLLIKNGLMTEIDGEMLAGGCLAWATWKHAIEELDKAGHVVKSPKSGFPVLNPFFSVASTSWEQYRKVLCSFGMNPADRSRTKSELDVARKSAKKKGISQYLT